MRHEDAVALLPDLVGGALAGERREALESHLADCTGCRETRQAFEAIHGALEDEQRHPASDQIVCYAVGPGLPPGDAAILERHLESCAACSDDVERVRLTDAESRGEPIVVRRAAPVAWRWAAAAALAGLAILVGVDVVLRTAEPEPWSGAVGLPVISSTLRTGGERAVVELADGQPVTPIAVALDPSSFDDAAGTLHFHIETSDGAARWEGQLPAARARSLLDADGVVTFLVPATALHDGRHRLRVVPARPADATSLLEVDFDVRR